MNELLYKYKYEYEERFNLLHNIRKEEQLKKIVDKDHPLFQVFEGLYKNPLERQKILFGNMEIPKKYENLYQWDYFEYIVFLPFCNFQKFIPGAFQSPANNDERPDEFVPNSRVYNVLEIQKKTDIHTYRDRLKPMLHQVGQAILELSPEVNSKLQKQANKSQFKFFQRDAIMLICGADSFGNYMYPGYDTIVKRINVCYKEAAGDKTKINWAAWIPEDRRNGKIQICSVLDAGCVEDAIKSVIQKKPEEESDIETIIIKARDKETKLGGVSTIKNVFLNNAESEVAEVKKLEFIKYPDSKTKNEQNFIRVASTANGRPLQYSKENSIFFVKSVSATDFEERLLSQCNSIAYQIYLDTKLKLLQKYGHGIAHRIIGNYIPFTSCLWSWRPGNVTGYGLHQDSTMLSSDEVKTFHYQEIVVTIIFHFGIINAGEKGAELIISQTNKESKIVKISTFHNFIHIQLFGNQANLWHRASDTSENAATSRLVMTARRTGVKSPNDVMNNELMRIFGENDQRFNTRQIKQVNDTLTLQQILEFFDKGILYQIGKEISPSSLIGSVLNRGTNPRRKVSNPKARKKSVQSQENKDSDEIELELNDDNENNNTCTTQAATASSTFASTTTESTLAASTTDEIDYYNITSPRKEHHCRQKTIFIQHEFLGEAFLLTSKALQILFNQKLCIESSVQNQKGYKKNILWGPMFKKDGSIWEIGDEIPLTTYKNYHNIKESDMGGYIASNYIGTCTGICLLHPERMASHDQVVDVAKNKKSEPFKFYGSGGSSKVKGSYASSISAATCKAGGTLPSAQKLNTTNQLLVTLNRIERPLHFAIKLEQKKNDVDMVIYLGMFTILESHYGFHKHETTFRRESCHNLHGASFLHEKSWLFHAVPFLVDYQSEAKDWDVYGIDSGSTPLSFGCLINQTANEALKVDSEFIKNDILFEMMQKDKELKKNFFCDTYKLMEETDLKALQDCIISKQANFDDDDSDNGYHFEEDDVMEE